MNISKRHHLLDKFDKHVSKQGADGKCSIVKFNGDSEKAIKKAQAWLKAEKTKL